MNVIVVLKIVYPQSLFQVFFGVNKALQCFDIVLLGAYVLRFCLREVQARIDTLNKFNPGAIPDLFGQAPVLQGVPVILESK